MPDSFTNDFAIIGEGPTDHAVLKWILNGYFKNQFRPPIITAAQPLPKATGTGHEIGGWENVFRYLEEKKYRDALQFNRFAIIQIDTDQCEHENFGVSCLENGKDIAVPILISRVIEKLRSLIGAEDCAKYEGRIIFAVCVHSIECWILPLWDQDSASATKNCLKRLNHALYLQKQPTIPEPKTVPPYDNAAKPYRKRDELLARGSLNPSLAAFIEHLGSFSIVLEAPAN
jgi:hypothetical protein